MVEITYHKEGDFFVPDLYLEKENYENDYIIGKYGHLRLEYLKQHKKAEYMIMFMNKTLRKHIVETDKQAKERFEILMKQMLERNPIDENLKNTDSTSQLSIQLCIAPGYLFFHFSSSSNKLV